MSDPRGRRTPEVVATAAEFGGAPAAGDAAAREESGPAPGLLSRPEEGSAPAAAQPEPAASDRSWHLTPQEQDMMASFRRDYLDLLEGRVTRITGLVEAAQTEPAVVALLSLESSSSMVGAHDLAAAGRRLRVALGTPGVDLTVLTHQLSAEAETARGRLAPGTT